MNFWQKLNKNKPILALAPMAGVTDSAFRQICKHYGADVVYTEMVSADGLYYGSKKTMELLKLSKKEKPIVVQLFGKRPETFIKAASVCQAAGFDGIDINFGCPAKKVVAHGGGVTLMRDLNRCRQIMEAVLSGTSLPVSVKIRAGIDDVTAVDFISNIKDLPIAALMVHGRYFKNPFSGPVDRDMIKRAKREFGGIVLANGGIASPEAAKEMLDKTGVDGLGLARGLYGQPWLFKQIKDYLKTDQYKTVGPIEIKKVILRHAKLALATKNSHGLVELRKHLLWYVAGWSEAKKLRSELVQVETLAAIEQILNRIS